MRFLFLFLLLIVLLTGCGRDTTGMNDQTVTTAAAPASNASGPAAKRNQTELAKPDLTGEVQVGRDAMAPADDFRNNQGTADREEARRMGPGSNRNGSTGGQQLDGTGTPQAAPAQFELKDNMGPISIKDIKEQEVFTVSKTPCYGDCKQYSVTFYANGLMTLNAKKNLDREGLFCVVPMAAQRTNLEAQFRRAVGAGLVTVYPEGETVAADIPATVLRYPGADGRRQSVKVYSDAPTALEELFRMVEAIVEKGDWVKAVE